MDQVGPGLAYPLDGGTGVGGSEWGQLGSRQEEAALVIRDPVFFPSILRAKGSLCIYSVL